MYFKLPMKSIKQSAIQNGFTLIELIVVIILISIMAVTVLPKFLTSNGFEEYTYRDELVIKLRAIQLRTMQQTSGSTCHQIQIGTSPNAIGLLETDSDIAATDLCMASYAGDSTTVTISNNHNVSFTISEGLTRFSFSSLGKPVAVGCGDATTPCKITLTVVGESQPQVEINSEGYIHAI